QPRERDLQSSGIVQLMQRLELRSYDELQAFAIREPERYWNAVMRHCAIVWDTPPKGYLDASRGPEFPRWFPGGRLNWVHTVLAWAGRPESAARPASLAER